MLAAVLKDFNDLVLEEVPTPAPGPGEVLVRIKSCGFCATDYKAIKGIRRNVTCPLIPGHEPSGVIGAPAPGEMPEYLKDSIGFKIRKNSGNVLLRDCYADTSTIGFLNEGWEVRILGCCFFYNTGCIRHVKPEKLDKMVIFKQPGGSMLVADCMVSKQVKGMKIYEGTGNARFRDIIYCGKAYEPGEVKPGACAFKMDQPHDPKLAN